MQASRFSLLGPLLPASSPHAQVQRLPATLDPEPPGLAGPGPSPPRFLPAACGSSGGACGSTGPGRSGVSGVSGGSGGSCGAGGSNGACGSNGSGPSGGSGGSGGAGCSNGSGGAGGAAGSGDVGDSNGSGGSLLGAGSSGGSGPGPSSGAGFGPPQRLRQWSGDILSLPGSLSASPRMGSDTVSYLPSPALLFVLEVGKASIAPGLLQAFSQHLLRYLSPLLAGMPPMGRFGAGSSAYWCLELCPSGTHFAALSRDLSHSGHLSVLWDDRHVSVPVSSAAPMLPPSALQLKFLNVPTSCSKVGLPDAVLSLAGYRPATPSPGVTPAPGSDTVIILRFRLGSHANAAIFIVDVLPPPDDPHLHRLPAFTSFTAQAPGPVRPATVTLRPKDRTA